MFLMPIFFQYRRIFCCFDQILFLSGAYLQIRLF